jgi:hypothetical protein
MNIEIFYSILGWGMFYFWIHAVIIIIKKTDVKGYERVVLIVALVFAFLYLVGTAGDLAAN